MNLHALAAALMIDAQVRPAELDLDQVARLPDHLARPILLEALQRMIDAVG